MLFASKQEIRKSYLQKRAALLPKDAKKLSNEICKNFYANISVKKRSIIAGYISERNEVDIQILLDLYAEDGHEISLPCVSEKDQPMTFRKYKKCAELVTNNQFKFKQPPSNFPEVIPDVIIVPLVSFDSAGSRIGMGAGFYDRTLQDFLDKSYEFIAVGVAYSMQQTQYIKPETFDFKLDSIVTEKKVFVF